MTARTTEVNDILTAALNNNLDAVIGYTAKIFIKALNEIDPDNKATTKWGKEKIFNEIITILQDREKNSPLNDPQTFTDIINDPTADDEMKAAAARRIEHLNTTAEGWTATMTTEWGEPKSVTAKDRKAALKKLRRVIRKEGLSIKNAAKITDEGNTTTIHFM